MDNHQYSVPVAPPAHANRAGDHFNALMSVIGRSGISVDALADRAEGVRFDGRFQIPHAPSASLAPWARHDAQADVDTEILQWIVSHVPSRKRSKSH
jgi:hypothetical protein